MNDRNGDDVTLNPRHHIEVKDQGITVTKSLALTFFIFLLGLGGTAVGQLSALEEAVAQVSAQQYDASRKAEALGIRVNALEREQSESRANLISLQNTMANALSRIETRLVSIDDRLREQETTR